MNQRELILIEFPFSDLSEIKTRPTIIVSNDTYNNNNSDILVCAVTSNPKEYDYSVPIKPPDMESGNLLLPSTIKADKLMLISKKQAIKTLGKISQQKFSETTQKIQKLVSPKSTEEARKP